LAGKRQIRMEEMVLERGPTVDGVDDRTPVAWRDLRDWLKLVEQEGQLKRITSPVDPDEELAALTFMAGRTPETPALLFNNLVGNRTDARILSNMLGASKERYALAVGLDPDASTSELIMADLMKHRLAPVQIPKHEAPVNEIVEQGSDVDITSFPSPKFWPGDGGRYIGTGDITITRDPQTGRINIGVYRRMVHGPARVGLYCSPGKHGRLDREAWWARGEPREVVAPAPQLGAFRKD
jgi:UbiD family decarboxylase